MGCTGLPATIFGHIWLESALAGALVGGLVLRSQGAANFNPVSILLGGVVTGVVVFFVLEVAECNMCEDQIFDSTILCLLKNISVDVGTGVAKSLGKLFNVGGWEDKLGL